MPDPIIISFTGFAQVGKDYTASRLQSYLIDNYDTVAPITSFASPIKEIAHTFFPLLSHDKTIPATRKMYQETGSLLRHYLGPDVFVNALDNAVHSDNNDGIYVYLVPDARYPEEISYILGDNLRNHIIHVTSPTTPGPVNTHISELAHLAIKDHTGKYFNPRIMHYENALENNPDELFRTICSKIFPV